MNRAANSYDFQFEFHRNYEAIFYRFFGYYRLFSKNYRSHVTVTTHLSGQLVLRSLGLATINMHTKFEVSSLRRSRYRPYLRGAKNLKSFTWSDQAHFRNGLLCRLGLAILNPRTKFEVSTITCNEDMKGTPNVKIFALSHQSSFGEIRGNA